MAGRCRPVLRASASTTWTHTRTPERVRPCVRDGDNTLLCGWLTGIVETPTVTSEMRTTGRTAVGLTTGARADELVCTRWCSACTKCCTDSGLSRRSSNRRHVPYLICGFNDVCRLHACSAGVRRGPKDSIVVVTRCTVVDDYLVVCNPLYVTNRPELSSVAWSTSP